MSHDLCFRNLRFVTESNTYSSCNNSNFIEHFSINYKNKNLYYDDKLSTFIAFIPNKSCLFLSIKYQPDQQQFNVKFFYGYFLKTKIMEFIMKIPNKDFVNLEKEFLNITDNDLSGDLDSFSQYVVDMINKCPFTYAKNKELKKIGQSGVPTYWGFSKSSFIPSINSEKKTQLFRCHLSEDKNFSQVESYQIIKNKLRRFYKNGGVDFVDNYMKGKHSLVKTPYYVSVNVLDSEDWFLISDFSTFFTGYMEYFHGKCSYIKKSDIYIKQLLENDSTSCVPDMLTKYSMDYFEYNKSEKVEKKIIDLGLDHRNMTEQDFEVLEMYRFD